MAATNEATIGKGEALAILRAGRDRETNPTVGKADRADPSVDPVAEAARTLGQRAAQKRAENSAQRVPADRQPDKLATPNRPAPVTDKLEDDPEDNADDAAPDGHDDDATEEQSEDLATAADDDDGDNATIEIDGEKLTKQEIRDSYLRRADYSQKTAEVAEARKRLDGVLANVTQNSQRIEQLVGLLEQAVGQEPDWSTLAMQMQPQQYLSYKENWIAQKQALNNARNEQSRAVDLSIQQAKQSMFDEAARTFRPEWQDRAKMQEGVSKLADFAVSMGINPDELKMLHRTPMLRILDMAYELQSMKSSQRITDKKVRAKPKPVRPGTQPPRQSAVEAELQSERQTWESNKRPDTKASLRWLNAKRAYESATGRRA